jgi:hypothetical protein
MIPKNAKVFPLKHNSKEPATLRGHLDAVLYDPEKIEITDNYGMSLDDQWLVVDFDCPADHPDRVALEETLASTWTQATLKPHGRHYLYTVPEGFTSKNAKITGQDGTHIADVKVKGYIVGPGSKVDGKPYKVLLPIEPSPASETLLNLVLAPSRGLHVNSGTSEEYSGVPKGQHDNFLQSAGGWLRDKWGLDADALYRIEREGLLAALKDPDPSDPYTEEDSLKRAKRLAHHDTHVAPSYEILDGFGVTTDEDFDMPLLDWYIHGFILKGGYFMTGFAPGGTGKSSFGHFLAARVTSLGDDFLVINHEDSPKYWKACAKVSGALGSKLHSLDKPLSIQIFSSREKEQKGIQKLEKIIEKYNLKFIWFDSLKNHLVLDRGDIQTEASNALANLADLATRTGCAIFGVFHTNKKGLPGGSTSFLDVARHVLEFKRERNLPLFVKVEKTNVHTPNHALKMIGESKPLINPDNKKRSLQERLESGQIVTRESWITTSYVQDSEILRTMQEDREKLEIREKALELIKTMTQTEASKILGISQSALSKLLNYKG